VIAPGGSCETPLVAAGVLTCSFGYACGGTPGSQTCVIAQCFDGADNNGDGTTDYPNDPGCTSLSDNTETTVCPGPTCPTCADGLDNDGDGTIDFPADPGCLAASEIEACRQSEAIAVITQRVTTGTTATATNDVAPTCTTGTQTTPDVALQLEIPAMARLSIDVTGITDVTSLFGASCSGTPIACSDPTPMLVTDVAAGTYYVVIDGKGTLSGGAWTLTTTGVVAPGGSCEGTLFAAGAFTCGYGTTCSGAPGSRTCALTECTDGIDNNGDGLVDALDAGCTSAMDGTEETLCPGPMCPVCSNAIDDDLDIAIDFPADSGCTMAGSTSEAFCPAEPEPPVAILTPATTGTLATALDNYDQSCQATTGNDTAFTLHLPVRVSSLQIDTIGSTVSDTVVSLWEASCALELACDDDSAPGTAGLRSLLVAQYLPPGNYAIQVDGFSTSNNGAFTLNVKGTVAPGTVCTDPLFTSGVLVCPMGTSCTAGTCQ
jgi:hypothetical protein